MGFGVQLHAEMHTASNIHDISLCICVGVLFHIFCGFKPLMKV